MCNPANASKLLVKTCFFLTNSVVRFVCQLLKLDLCINLKWISSLIFIYFPPPRATNTSHCSCLSSASPSAQQKAVAPPQWGAPLLTEFPPARCLRHRQHCCHQPGSSTGMPFYAKNRHWVTVTFMSFFSSLHSKCRTWEADKYVSNSLCCFPMSVAKLGRF